MEPPSPVRLIRHVDEAKGVQVGWRTFTVSFDVAYPAKSGTWMLAVDPARAALTGPTGPGHSAGRKRCASE